MTKHTIFHKFPYIFSFANILYPWTVCVPLLMNYHLVRTKSAKIDGRRGVLRESQRIHIPQNLALGPHEHIRDNNYKRVCDNALLTIRMNAGVALTDVPGGLSARLYCSRCWRPHLAEGSPNISEGSPTPPGAGMPTAMPAPPTQLPLGLGGLWPRAHKDLMLRP